MEAERQFRIALSENNVDTALQLLNELTELEGCTAVDLLHLAAQQGHACIVERMIEIHPESIDTRSPCEKLALHCAAECGQTEIVKLLARLGSQSLNSYVSSQCDTETVMHLVAKNGHTETLEMLVQLGCTHLDTPGMSNKTPFYKAIESGHLDTARTIIRLGSQALDVPASSGSTPLHVAAANADEPAVQFILDSGSKAFKHRNFYSEVPLYQAVRSGSMSIVKILLKCSNDRIANTDKGWTPLHSAAAGDHVPMIEFLLENRYVDVHARNYEGVTPFFTAVIAGKEEAMITLLRFDSSVLQCTRQTVYSTTDEGDATTRRYTPLEFVFTIQRIIPLARYLLCLEPIDASKPSNVSQKHRDRLLALQSKITEEERHEVRFPIYFAESLVLRLLRANAIIDNGARRFPRRRRSTATN